MPSIQPTVDRGGGRTYLVGFVLALYGLDFQEIFKEMVPTGIQFTGVGRMGSVCICVNDMT